jgi:hypothetical protein
MAYNPLSLGYVPQQGQNYAGTTGSPADWGTVPNDTLFYDLTKKTVYYKDANGSVYGQRSQGLLEYNTCSSQWSTVAPSTTLSNGSVANGCTFFTSADKVASGTTSFAEFNIAFGLSFQLSGTSGTANLSFDFGTTNYLMTFNTSLYQTAVDFVALHEEDLNDSNIRVFALGSGSDGRLRFCAQERPLNDMTLTNVTTNLSGTKVQEFVGGTAAAQDHILVPYNGQPYAGQRLLHTIRTNFNINTGSVQYAELGLFRYQDDSLIGSSITVTRNNDTTGSQQVLETYTNSATDPFVIGGFYPAVANNTGATLTFSGNAGILVQTVFERSTSFNT